MPGVTIRGSPISRSRMEKYPAGDVRRNFDSVEYRLPGSPPPAEEPSRFPSVLNAEVDAIPNKRSGTDRVKNFEAMVEYQFFLRRQVIDHLLDPRHNVDRECGYPSDITPIMYRMMFERDGVARRVVEIMPKESWAVQPEVIETHDAEEETDFEKAFADLVQKQQLWQFLKRADILSGIGRFGIILLGLGDGRDMSQPVAGIDDMGRMIPGAPKHDLLFLRVFDETVARVNMRESNTNNPRFGRPTMYTLTFKDLDITELAGSGIATVGDITKRVHWTRVIHVCDNREMSEIYGCPRMKPVFNRLMDNRKIAGGSGEMYWKGAFPGISFELMPGVGDVELDQASIEKQMAQYSNGLQRYLALQGMTAKSLAPTIADPDKHINMQIEQICIALAIPARIFKGSEESRLASSQDMKTWNRRVSERHDDYVTPQLIRQIVDRLITYRILPEPKQYEVVWPDLNTSTDLEKAQVALTKTQAMQAYVIGGCDVLIPPEDFLAEVLDIEHARVAAMLKGAIEAAEAASAIPGGSDDDSTGSPKGSTGSRGRHKVTVKVPKDKESKVSADPQARGGVRNIGASLVPIGADGKKPKRVPSERDAFEEDAPRVDKGIAKKSKTSRYRDGYKAATPPNRKNGGPGIAPTATSLLEEASADQMSMP